MCRFTFVCRSFSISAAEATAASGRNRELRLGPRPAGCLEKDKAVAVEVKRQKKNYKPDLLEKKVERLKHKILPHYMITKMCLSLEDM